VVQAEDNREVIGLLTETYALRRYSSGLEQRRQEMLGE
jgi:chloride channel protein, CIC family